MAPDRMPWTPLRERISRIDWLSHVDLRVCSDWARQSIKNEESGGIDMPIFRISGGKLKKLHTVPLDKEKESADVARS